MGTVLQDLRQTVRSLSRSAGFSAAAILTMALGIAVNTSVFSIVHGTLLSPLPYPHADRLTFIWKDLTEANYPRAPLSGPEVADLRKGSSLHERIGAIWATSGTLVDENRPEPLRLAMVTTNFLSVLGVPPVRGRWLAAADEQGGSSPSIVISGGLWQARFGGGEVIGRQIRIDGGWGMDGGQFTVVGVMPPGFEMLLPLDASVPKTVDAWIPFQFDLASAPPGVSYLRTVGRLAPGASLADAQHQVENAGREIVKRFGRPRRFYAEPLHGDLVRQARPALIALQAAVAFVLLIACANVASLLTVRFQARRREIAVRTALGASRRQLTRLLLTESLLLAAAGGLLGVALAYVGLRLLPLLGAEVLPRADAIRLSAPVLGFSALATLACGILFGIAPLLEWRRADLLAPVRTAGRSAAAVAPVRTRSVLVLAEIGLSVVLLVGAGLLIRTFLNLYAVDPGYRSHQVLTFVLSLPPERYGSPDTLARFTRTLETELRAIPGVQAAGAINQLPLDDVPNWTTPYLIAGADPQRGAPEADARLVTPGYFEAIGATMVAGRPFTNEDDETQALSLVVDERLARKAWPDENPIDRELGVRVFTPKGLVLRWGRVVGVVRHLRHHRLSEEVREQVFVPFAQAPRPQMGVVVRASVEPEALTRDIARQIGRIDPNLAPARVQPLDYYTGRSRAPARFSMVLASVFGALSLLLACLGLYGVISYSVAQRTSELGVRAALGASRRDLLALVLRQGVVLTSAGLALGLVGAALVTRWLTSLLFGVTASDFATFAGVPLLLGLTALTASYVAARRAVRVDAAEALRAE